MKSKRLFLLLFLLSNLIFSQKEHPFVKLEQVKQGKRVNLYVVNTDTISYDVFLKITTNNYRRSSNRPILRSVAANSKIKINTLIHIKDKPENFDSIFIVNEVSNDIEIRKTKDNFDIKFDQALHKKKISLFTKTQCYICPQAKSILSKNRVPFQEYNIDKDTAYYSLIVKEIKQKNPKNNFTVMPLMKIGDSIYTDIKTVNDFVKYLKQGLKN